MLIFGGPGQSGAAEFAGLIHRYGAGGTPALIQDKAVGAVPACAGLVIAQHLPAARASPAALDTVIGPRAFRPEQDRLHGCATCRAIHDARRRFQLALRRGIEISAHDLRQAGTSSTQCRFVEIGGRIKADPALGGHHGTILAAVTPQVATR